MTERERNFLRADSAREQVWAGLRRHLDDYRRLADELAAAPEGTADENLTRMAVFVVLSELLHRAAEHERAAT